MGWRDKILDNEAMTDREIEQALAWVDALTERAGEKAADASNSLRWQIRHVQDDLDALERAWDAWDWRGLADAGIITQDAADQAEEILARFSP